MKKLSKETTSWSFQLDNIPTFAYQENAFSKDECQSIIDLSEEYLLKNATVKDNKISKIRDSKICWIMPELDTEWIFRRITDVVLDLNNKYFQFDISGLNEGLQFTKYIAPTGEYGKHIDRRANFIIRKLSLSVLLNDTKDYEGGELKFFEDDKGTDSTKKQGSLILFPSFVLHQVTPVTKGERNSLVAWVTGSNFK